jgi:hypothetical protein
MKLKSGNIYSRDKSRAVFTNPTELAYKHGCLKQHYPVTVRGIQYPDAEAAYQGIKKMSKMMTFEELQDLCTEVLIAKLQQYPILVETITESGGVLWIEQCSHHTYARMSTYSDWEGDGLTSAFIRCLKRAYLIVKITIQEEK